MSPREGKERWEWISVVIEATAVDTLLHLAQSLPPVLPQPSSKWSGQTEQIKAQDAQSEPEVQIGNK